MTFDLGEFLFPMEFIIREIPQGESEDTAPFARSQKASFSRSGFSVAEPVATADAMQKIHAESIRENVKKLLFEPLLGLFESAAAPTPATNRDMA